MRHSSLRIAAAACAVLLATLTLPAPAQVEVRVGDSHFGKIQTLANGTLTVEVLDESAGGGWAGTITAQVADLDVAPAEVEENGNSGLFEVRLNCKDGALCVSRRGHWVGLQMEGNGSPNYDDSIIVVACRTRDECQGFLDALKASVR